MATITTNYDPAKVIVNINGANIEGYAEGEFITAERNSDGYTLERSLDGHVTRVKSNDYTGELTLTLKKSSPSNDFLMALAILDETSGEGIFPLMVKDVLGNTQCSSGASWIRKIPTVSMAKEHGNIVWKISCSELLMNVGGSKPYIA